MQLTSEDERRIRILTSVVEKSISVRTAARILHRSERQIYRLLARLRNNGPSGLTHGNRGRQPLNKIDAAVWDKVLDLVRTDYAKLNDTQILRMLKRRHQIVVSQESLRKKLREAGIPAKSRRSVNEAKAETSAEAAGAERSVATSANFR